MYPCKRKTSDAKAAFVFLAWVAPEYPAKQEKSAEGANSGACSSYFKERSRT